MTSRISWIWDSGPVRGLPVLPFAAVALGVLWLARPLDSRLTGWLAAAQALDLRTEATAAFVGMAVVASVLMPGMYSPWLPVMWIALAGAVVTSRTRSLGPLWAAGAVATILVSHLVALPLAATAQTGETFTRALLMLPLVGLYIIGPHPRAWAWLAGFGIVHAGALIASGAMGAVRAGGFMPHNPNLAAGVLVLTAIYFVHRRSPIAFIPLAAIVFTGSRWASVVALVVIVAMLAKDRMTVRKLIGAAVIVGALGAASHWGPVHAGYRLNGLVSLAGQAVHDASVRLELSPLPNFIPQGSMPSRQHSTIIRIAVETGILSAVAWIALTLAALIRTNAHPQNESNTRPHDKTHVPIKCSYIADRQLHRWLLLAVVGLGAMDYYIWLAQLAPVWWLLVGALVNQPYVSRRYRIGWRARALTLFSAMRWRHQVPAPASPTIPPTEGHLATISAAAAQLPETPSQRLDR